MLDDFWALGVVLVDALPVGQNRIDPSRRRRSIYFVDGKFGEPAMLGLFPYELLVICDIAFEWFLTDSAGACVEFAIAYLITLTLMTVVFTMIYRHNIKKLNGGLQKFKAKV